MKNKRIEKLRDKIYERWEIIAKINEIIRLVNYLLEKSDENKI